LRGTILKKTGIFLLLFVISCLLAAVYGIVHDQISYTVSPEYYTRFKFIQFSIPPGFQNRIGVGAVGFFATWWMGIVIGIFLIPVGLVIPEWKYYLFAMLRCFGVVALTALVVGLGALVWGKVTYSPAAIYFPIPESVIDRESFYLAGNMHNFSYIGGGVGILTGIIWILLERTRISRKLR
jgi:hypothetical protein